MDMVVSLLVLSALPQLVAPESLNVTPYKAVVESVSGLKRIFSGESINLRCSIPDHGQSTWTYKWFSGSILLLETQEHITLSNLHVQDSGKYFCQGERDSPVGIIQTLLSSPIEIIVDGGWALVEVPLLPGLVGESATVRCRTRRTPSDVEMILYKDGAQVMKQKGLNRDFNLPNLTLKDQGMYSCRVSWHASSRTYSVISDPALLEVVEVLTEPHLEFITHNVTPTMMKVVCQHEYNARPPAPLHYYFYKDGQRLGVSTSENHDLIKRKPGVYSCKVKVPRLGIIRQSVPKTYGRVTEPQAEKPSVPRSSMLRPQAPPVSSPEPSVLATEPPASPTSNPSGPPTLQASPSTLVSTTQPLIQTASAETFNTTVGSVDMSEGSGDMPGESGEVLPNPHKLR